MQGQVMLQEMERRLADLKKSTDERISQGESFFQEAQESWQEAVARASEAECRERELEKTVSHLQEQLHVDQIHRQLWPPHQSEAPVTQVAQGSSGDTLMDEPATQVVENSTPVTSMEEPNERNRDDTEMVEVNKII
jgi:hypothetical protein